MPRLPAVRMCAAACLFPSPPSGLTAILTASREHSTQEARGSAWGGPSPALGAQGHSGDSLIRPMSPPPALVGSTYALRAVGQPPSLRLNTTHLILLGLPHPSLVRLHSPPGLPVSLGGHPPPDLPAPRSPPPSPRPASFLSPAHLATSCSSPHRALRRMLSVVATSVWRPVDGSGRSGH